MDEDFELTVQDVRLSTDLRRAASRLTPTEAKILCRMFDQTQRARIRFQNQIAAAERDGSPASVLNHFYGIQIALEGQIAAAMKKFGESQPLTQWMTAQTGVGPLIAVRLFAIVDWNGAWNPSAIHRFAGLDPSLEWGKGQKRPWNADLKRLMYLLGESFVKNQTRKNAYYPDWFARQKKLTWERNIAGSFKSRALELSSKFDKNTAAYHWHIGKVSAAKAQIVAKGKWPAEIAPWEPLSDYVLMGSRSIDEILAMKTLAKTPLKKLEQKEKDGKLTKAEGEAWRLLVILPESRRELLIAEAKNLPSAEDYLAAIPDGLPMLPPAHIHAMARRWTVKLFISHAWEVAQNLLPEGERKDVKPYAIAKLGHPEEHIIVPPPAG